MIFGVAGNSYGSARAMVAFAGACARHGGLTVYWLGNLLGYARGTEEAIRIALTGRPISGWAEFVLTGRTSIDFNPYARTVFDDAGQALREAGRLDVVRSWPTQIDRGALRLLNHNGAGPWTCPDHIAELLPKHGKLSLLSPSIGDPYVLLHDGTKVAMMEGRAMPLGSLTNGMAAIGSLVQRAQPGLGWGAIVDEERATIASCSVPYELEDETIVSIGEVRLVAPPPPRNPRNP